MLALSLNTCGTERESVAPSELTGGRTSYPGFAPGAIITTSFGGKTGVEH